MTHDLSTLLDGLASPDPAIRDGWAAAELYSGITDGRFAGDHEQILEVCTARLRDSAPWARSFAVLALGWLAANGTFDRASWDVFRTWYTSEADTRGHDQQYGWIHAVAHGADYLAQVVEYGWVSADDALQVVSARMLGPGEVWLAHEDARLARAAAFALARCDETPEEATLWLQPVLDELQAAPSMQVTPPWVHNVSQTCALLHLTLSTEDGWGVSGSAGGAETERFGDVDGDGLDDDGADSGHAPEPTTSDLSPRSTRAPRRVRDAALSVLEQVVYMIQPYLADRPSPRHGANSAAGQEKTLL